MQIIKILNQIIAFLLELGMLSAMGYWGYLQGKTKITQYFIAILLIATGIALWAYFAAPKSANRLSLEYRMVFELVLFLLSTWMIYKSGYTSFAIAFGIISLLNLVVEYFLGE